MRQLERSGLVAEFDRPIRSTRIARLLFAVSVSVLLAVVTTASTLAAPPTLPTLNPPPPAFQTCMATGGGAICSGTQVVATDGPSGLFCGTTANPIELLFVDASSTVKVIRFYNADGNLTRRIRREQNVATVLNPVTGLTALTTQVGEFTGILATPGDFDTETLTQRGVVKFYLPGAGVLFIDVGRDVIPPDGGDTDTGLVVPAVCEALGSPGTPSVS